MRTLKEGVVGRGSRRLRSEKGMAEAHLPSKEEARFSGLTNLRNRIFIMRHGQSEANARGLIVCSPDVGCSSYGLTDLGRSQVLEIFILPSSTIS
ncbi:hypothetical protein GBAR_LOCUS6566 [Geodia barretti]|uniref:Phosphoglycerate mutase n=1 Tax=Geodia barretti TaxID=519541 RepID=A0AA35RER6_GEOBA|nr:hypothetical protein GBAR_LOCUS6566 [Geodia barretti]